MGLSLGSWGDSGREGGAVAATGDEALADPAMANLERTSESWRDADCWRSSKWKGGHRPEGSVAVIIEVPNGGCQWCSLGGTGVESGSAAGRRGGTGRGLRCYYCRSSKRSPPVVKPWHRRSRMGSSQRWAQGGSFGHSSSIGEEDDGKHENVLGTLLERMRALLCAPGES